MNKGYLAAISAAIIAAIWDVFTRFNIDALGANPSVYAGLSMFTASFFLIMLSGSGKGGLETLRSTHTWLFAFFQIILVLIEAYSYWFVTATEFNFLLRISLITSLILSFIFLSRVPKRHDYVAMAGVLIGVAIIGATLPEETRIVSLVLLAVYSILFSLRAIITETHPASNAAKTMKEQFRVTGYTLFVTSLFYLIFYFLAGIIFDELNLGAEFSLPSLADFSNSKGIFMALIAGIFIIPAFFVLNFMANKLVKNEKYIAIITITPVTAMILEKAGSHFTPLINASSIDRYDALAAVFIIGGTLFKIYFDIKADSKKEKT